MEPVCEICGQQMLRRVSGGKFWCAGCGYLQS
jgi:ribosomal protein L37AE/L43A